MKVTQIKFVNSVVLDGRQETYFNEKTQGLRGVEVSLEAGFMKFRPTLSQNPVTMVPLQNVAYVILGEEKREDKTTGKRASVKPETSVNVGSPK